MTSRVAVLGLALFLGTVLVFQAAAVPKPIVPAERAQAPSRLVDRTMACAVPLHAGLREIKVGATSGSRDPQNRSRWTHLPNVSVTTGGTLGGVGLAGAAAGAPEPKEILFPGTGQGLWTSRSCGLTNARVALSTRGLPQGGLASTLRDAYECVVPRRVLIRVRATFQVPARLRARRSSLGTDAPVREVAIAVRTTAGKPLVYASASESGRARLFTSASCLPD
jgi:hypothetical protein